MSENPRLAALTELGALFRGGRVDECAAGPVHDDLPRHAVSDHTPLWAFERPQYQRPFAGSQQAVFDFLPEGCSVERAQAFTRLHVVLGAVESETFDSLCDCGQNVVLVFDPDEERIARLAESRGVKELVAKGLIFFSGDVYDFSPPLQELLPEKLFTMGFPVFHVSESLRESCPQWVRSVIEYVEILFYRHVIYKVCNQRLLKSVPIRNITRGMMYDQQLHAYENIPEYLTRPGMDVLRNAFSDETAILVAAGPDLGEKIEFIRENADRAVIICVNNAVKPLLEADVRPHFVIINDNSLASGEVFRRIPQSPGTILVGHCLSDLGGDRFRQKYLFGSFMPEVFPERPMLRLHGSVISTAFSLARHMGCAGTVLVGARLGSDNPWSLSYAKGTVHHDSRDTAARELINRHPQLCPVELPDGRTVYSTPNFRDAALWLCEEIRTSGIECVNTSEGSLLFGKGIAYDPAPVLERRSIGSRFSRLFSAPEPRVNLRGCTAFIERDLSLWKQIADASKQLRHADDASLLAKGAAVLEQMDGSNISNMVERFDGFDSRHFHAEVFESGDAERQAEGLRYYFRHVERMAKTFLMALGKARRACDAARERG